MAVTIVYRKVVTFGRMTFPQCTAAVKTNDSFRARENKVLHTGFSPYILLPVNMIKFFHIDCMHQTCLGEKYMNLNLISVVVNSHNKVQHLNRDIDSDQLTSKIFQQFTDGILNLFLLLANCNLVCFIYSWISFC